MAKINFRNIALLFGVSVLNIGIGFYDRLVNGVGIVRLADFYFTQAQSSTPLTLPQDMPLVLTNSISATNLLALGVFILIAVFVIGIMAGTLGRGGMA